MSSPKAAGACLLRRLRKVCGACSGTAITLTLVLILSALLIACTGTNPLSAFAEIFRGSFGSKRMLGETLVMMCPLLLTGLGLTITFRSGLSSVGAEGQIIVGGVACSVAALSFSASAPPLLAIPVCLLAGGMGGAVWAALPGFLKAKMGTSELVNTVMMNYIASYFLSWMLTDVIKDPEGFYPQSARIPRSAQIGTLMDGSRAHWGILLALLLALLVYWLLWRTPMGYQLRVVGYNRSAALYVGIPIERNVVLAMAMHGFFSGLAGAVEILAVQYRCITGFSNNVGFDGIAVSLLGKNHPIGVVISSLALAALRSGSGNMQRTLQVPTSLVSVMQGLIICLVLMDHYFKDKLLLLLRSLRAGRSRRKKEAVG